MTQILKVPFIVAALSGAAFAATSIYAGPEICAQCHVDIAKMQAQTAMANTWRGSMPRAFGENFNPRAAGTQGAHQSYQVRFQGKRLECTLALPNGAALMLPVEVVVGGRRNGFSFLERIDKVNGIPLERSALIEGRYAYRQNASGSGLVVSPGFDPATPATLGDALGRVLSPAFAQKCLTCHGEPNTLGAGNLGGVRCESCHGPAAEHVASVTSAAHAGRLVTPNKLTRANAMTVCAQCHTGLANRTDPIPEDVLVSSQVTALSNSECFIQSGGDVTCVDCHNPHQDSVHVAERSVNTCLRCHSLSLQRHASICPVNKTVGCIGCHMPSVSENAFHLTDHWIRVHPEQNASVHQPDAALRSRVEPKHEFLRIIVVATHDEAVKAIQRLAKGESFTTVAHDVSMDPTASGGGYIGDMDLSQMDERLRSAAARLEYNETSGIIDLNNRCVILHRMPRDFKEQAAQVFQQATALKAKGDLKAAVEKDQEALRIYPYFLRALVFMGTSLGEAGNAERAREVLQFAVQSYPNDAPAQFDLALTLAREPSGEVQALRRALELDPELLAAYESLGAALYSVGKPNEAIDAFRKGLQVNPLSAILNYDLGLALVKKGDEAGGRQALALAEAIDPAISHRQ